MGFARRTLRFGGGLILGGAVGTAVSLLLAPQNGTQLRARLRDLREEARLAGEEAELVTTERLKNIFRQQVSDPIALTGQYQREAETDEQKAARKARDEAEKAQRAAKQADEEAAKKRDEEEQARRQVAKQSERVQEAEREATDAHAEADRLTTEARRAQDHAFARAASTPPDERPES